MFISHRLDVNVVILSVRSNPFDKNDLMPVIDRHDQKVGVGFGFSWPI
jgi:hypothetical protein